MNSSYTYPAEKFSQARSALMLPLPSGGEATAIATAFGEISIGLQNLDRTGLDQQARDWLDRLAELMDTSELSDPNGEGLHSVKAKRLSIEEKVELSRLVDELADYFNREAYG